MSCEQYVCAVILPCSILMDERDVDIQSLNQPLDGARQMAQVGDAGKQAGVHYRWSIECYSQQYRGDYGLTHGLALSDTVWHDKYVKKYTHKAFQKGILRCADASPPLQPDTDKSSTALTCAVAVQIDPAFYAEYTRERDKFFSENTQDRYQKRKEYFILVGPDGRTINSGNPEFERLDRGVVMIDGRQTMLPFVRTTWEGHDGKSPIDSMVEEELAADTKYLVKFRESEPPCIADWQCTAMMCCPLNMCLAPLWLYSMSKYRHKRTHTFKKTVGAFERRERTVVEMHSDNIPGRMQDVVNTMTGGLTGHLQAGGRW